MITTMTTMTDLQTTFYWVGVAVFLITLFIFAFINYTLALDSDESWGVRVFLFLSGLGWSVILGVATYRLLIVYT